MNNQVKLIFVNNNNNTNNNIPTEMFITSDYINNLTMRSEYFKCMIECLNREEDNSLVIVQYFIIII